MQNIKIEFVSNAPQMRQMVAVLKYMDKNRIHNYADHAEYKETKIDSRGLSCGEKIDSDDHWRFHVSCKKTKSGNYSFRVWNAV